MMFQSSACSSFCEDEDDAWANNLKVNCAFMAMREHGGGPVHLNWETKCSRIYNVRELPQQRYIQKYSSGSETSNHSCRKSGNFYRSTSAHRREIDQVN